MIVGDNSAFILGELARAGIEHEDHDPHNIYIQCPFHDDHKPSLGIHRSGKKANCWGCDWSGSWNKLARHIGLQPLSSLASVIDEGDTDYIKSLVKPELPDGLVPWPEDEDWRGISGATMSQFPAYKWIRVPPDVREIQTRVLLPVIDKKGVLHGYAARMYGIGSKYAPKYYNLPGMNSGKLLFGEHLVVGSSLVVLVEGPSDCLTLLDRGIACVAVLGAGHRTKIRDEVHWSFSKVIRLATMGIRGVIIAFDDDPAGRAGSRIAREDLLRGMDMVKRIRMPAGKDINNVGDAWLSKFNRYVRRVARENDLSMQLSLAP